MPQSAHRRLPEGEGLMTPDQQQRCGEAFEAWAMKEGYDINRAGYERFCSARDGYQAAWQAQEERTQKLVEALAIAKALTAKYLHRVSFEGFDDRQITELRVVHYQATDALAEHGATQPEGKKHGT